MLWIILALIVAVLKSLSELTGKIFTKENIKKTHIDEFSLALWGRYFALILLLPSIYFIEFQEFSLGMFWVLMASALLNSIGSITTLKAVKYWDLSLVWPLSSLTIPFLIVTGFIIAWEMPNVLGLLWVVCIFLGTYFLQIAKSKGGILWPIRALFEDKWAKYMIITSLLWSLTTPLDKLWIVEYWVFQWMLYSNILMALMTTVYALIYKKESFSHIREMKNIKKISLLTLIGGWALLIQMFALKITLAVYVISIKRASWIFSVIFWALFFKEKNIMQKLIAVSIMLIWVCIISIWGNI
jgi:uncharacterized membrane protein